MRTAKNEIAKLKEEIEKVRSQFYIFYELTKALRTTLRLDEIVYIILTGLTAHQGLAFNRAILFLVDEEEKRIRGFMGIGPMDSKEANLTWRYIEEEKKDLYDLIRVYHHIRKGKVKPKFMEFVKSLAFPLGEEGGFICQALWEKGPLHIKKHFKEKYYNDPLWQKLDLNEFLISSLWIRNNPQGAILVDNCITGKPITEEEVRIFNMFVEQAEGAIENSQEFEDTLTKAHTDYLTSLWNYGYFQHKLDEELIKASLDNSPLSIMMIDIDDFKKFNDTYGHLEGDIALKEISGIIKENCRKIDILCRYGGEEFSLILPYTTKEEAFLLGDRIRKAVQKLKIKGEHFTISIGVASFPFYRDKNTLIKHADHALYRAKREGKNRIILG